MKYSDIINFWFHELTPPDWFTKSDKLDSLIQERFGELHQKAISCELSLWRSTPLGRLAEIIIIDQFSRNIFRGDPRSFQYDSLALALSQEAIAKRADQDLETAKRAFLYMPFMHSESSEIHQEAVGLYSSPGLEKNLEFELAHKEIIDRFGRYPHRNKILGRESTPEEIEFLKLDGSSF